MILATIGVVSIGASIGAVLTAALAARGDALWARAAIGAGFGAWAALVATFVARGYTNDLRVFGLVFVASLTLAPLLWRNVPTRTIVALNVLRTLGVLFLLQALVGQLSGPFPYFAGIGDIITGFVALPTALRMGDDERFDARLLAWNAFGLTDLLVAVTLGLTSGNGSPLQIFHAGVGSAAIATLPWTLIPLFLVPLYMIGHVTIFMRAAAVRRIVPA